MAWQQLLLKSLQSQVTHPELNELHQGKVQEELIPASRGAAVLEEQPCACTQAKEGQAAWLTETHAGAGDGRCNRILAGANQRSCCLGGSGAGRDLLRSVPILVQAGAARRYRAAALSIALMPPACDFGIEAGRNA